MPRCLICGNEISNKDILEGNFYYVTDSKRTPVNFICYNCYGTKVVELQKKRQLTVKEH